MRASLPVRARQEQLHPPRRHPQAPCDASSQATEPVRLAGNSFMYHNNGVGPCARQISVDQQEPMTFTRATGGGAGLGFANAKRGALSSSSSLPTTGTPPRRVPALKAASSSPRCRARRPWSPSAPAWAQRGFPRPRPAAFRKRPGRRCGPWLETAAPRFRAPQAPATKKPLPRRHGPGRGVAL